MIDTNINGNIVSAAGITINCPFNVAKSWFEPIDGYFIVLMNYHENRSQKRFPNLVAYDPNGQIRWTAELPPGTGADSYTEVEIIGEHISAFSFSCHRCIIDKSSGKLLRYEFTK